MGLAVSQVRLLALTNRKADIELQMQVNSKRKQQLTRKATELSQEYYNRLQNTAIMYTTSSGYEDVDFNYVMGETNNGEYTSDFLQSVANAFNDGTVHKPEYKMILTDAFGQVVVNNTLAKVIAEVNDDNQYKTPADSATGETEAVSVEEKTAKAIMQLIQDTSQIGSPSFSAAFSSLYDLFTYTDPNSDERIIDEAEYKNCVGYFSAMIKNYDATSLNGGVIYCNNGEDNAAITSDPNVQYFSDPEGLHPIKPKSGYTYRIGKLGSRSAVGNTVLFYSETGTDAVATSITKGYAEKMRNIVEYFAPILSAAFKNGISTSVIRHTADDEHTYESIFEKQEDGTSIQKISSGKDEDGNVTYIEVPELTNETDVMNFFNDNKDMFPEKTISYVALNVNGLRQYYHVYKDEDGNVTNSQFNNGETIGNTIQRVSQDFYTRYEVSSDNNKVFTNASKVENLQSGLKSGAYQFCMVSDVDRGTYHKNTRLNYFTRQGYVSEKMDSSKREEITAWFNMEQAAISEKETYWDTEIQNLSTELNSVNTEIESVKQLKTNAIKSVFNWGGQ